MIFELGQRYLDFDWVQVTAAYSNAVLVALMPHVSDVAARLDLPLPRPITAEHVVYSQVASRRAISAEICVKGTNGQWFFACSEGHVDIVQGPHDFFTEQDPDRIPAYFGKVNLTKEQAVNKARETLRKLEVPLEVVFADQEPSVKGPEQVGTNIVPQYRVEWPDPRSGHARTAVHIDGEGGGLTRVKLMSPGIRRPRVKLPVVAQKAVNSPVWPQVNPEYAERLAPIVFRAIDGYSAALGLSVPRPLTTNQVGLFSISDNGGWPHVEIKLTNGWKFVFRNHGVNGYYSPDTFFNSDDRLIKIKEFRGVATINETQAIQLIKTMAARLDISSELLHLTVPPRMVKPTLDTIPRCLFMWHGENEEKTDLIFKLEAEVDMSKGEVVSFYFDHTSLWNKPPAIDVPIQLNTMDGGQAGLKNRK